MDNVLTMEDINRAIKALEKGPSDHFTAEDVKEFMDRVEKSMRFGINDFPEFEIYRGKKDFSGIKINTDRLKPKAGFGCMNLRSKRDGLHIEIDCIAKEGRNETV